MLATGKIAAVGQFNGYGQREIDTNGLLVTPGWVDTHSHMDGQATWDPFCSPVSNRTFRDYPAPLDI